MRRTRVVAAAFAGSVFLAALAPVAVAAEPVAEVSPHRVRPGGTVTVTVICPKHEEKVRYITAYSQAFEEGEADLRLVPRRGEYGKATYSGKARIASAHHSGSSGTSGSYGSDDSYGSEDSYSTDGSEDSYGSGDSYSSEGSYSSSESSDSYGSESSYSSSGSYSSDDSDSASDSYGSGSSRHGKRYGINGSCPDGSDFTTSVLVERKPRGGAHAGQGGSQGSVNTAAVAAGGALVSATVGFGVYVLRRRRSEV